jgi:hypothetical protein
MDEREQFDIDLLGHQAQYMSKNEWMPIARAALATTEATDAIAPTEGAVKEAYRKALRAVNHSRTIYEAETYLQRLLDSAPSPEAPAVDALTTGAVAMDWKKHPMACVQHTALADMNVVGFIVPSVHDKSLIDQIEEIVGQSSASKPKAVTGALPYKAAQDCPYENASEEIKCAWADGWNQCAQSTKGGNVDFKNFAEWNAHYLPNDFVMGDNTRNIAAVVTKDSLEKAMRLGELVAHPASGPKALTPEWLWCEFMDYCKRRGVAPANMNDLFEIVKRARALLANPET